METEEGRAHTHKENFTKGGKHKRRALRIRRSKKRLEQTFFYKVAPNKDLAQFWYYLYN